MCPLSSLPSSKTYDARATSTLNSSDIETVLCHRRIKGQEQYLVRWRSTSTKPKASTTCSWHDLKDLWRCLHLVQNYVESRPNTSLSVSNANHTSLKRKSPGSDIPISFSRDLTPQAYTNGSASVITISSSSDEEDEDGDNNEVTVYNAVLEKKDGWIVAKQSKRASKIDATTLPTQVMLREADNTPTQQAQRAIREAFYTKLKKLPRLYLENKVDASTPSLDFRFIRKYALGEGVHAADSETFLGCQNPCKPNMGQYCGCEYTTKCACLEYAAVDEKALERQDEDRYRHYKAQQAAGDLPDLLGLPKRFPYHKKKSNDDRFPQTLQQFYRESRHPIYECNLNCNCGLVCKSRVVQKGRKVPLTIFKMPTRGWGVKCNEPLIQGEFIDTYLGEVITSAETDRREATGSFDKASYLYSLDKWADEIGEENCLVVDGQHMGGATRFINHSCEPNIRQFTVSYNKHDLHMYDLAFFAIEDIPAGTELTFDYMDKDEQEEDDALRTREAAERDPKNAKKPRCNCGAKKCRGFLWL